MPRKRMIDPGIWIDDGMADLTARQQLLFIGLFSNADDSGRLRGSPAAIKLMLPTIYANVHLDRVRTDLSAVVAQMRHLKAYEADGREYLYFDNYPTWQKIEHASKSQIPEPPSIKEGDSPRTHRGLTEDSPKPRASLIRLGELDEVNQVNQVSESVGAIAPKRVTRAALTLDDENFVQEMVSLYGEYVGGEQGVRDAISLCLDNARKKGYTNAKACVRNWLSGDRRVLNGSGNGRRAQSNHPQPSGDRGGGDLSRFAAFDNG